MNKKHEVFGGVFGKNFYFDDLGRMVIDEKLLSAVNGAIALDAENPFQDPLLPGSSNTHCTYINASCLNGTC